MRWKAKREPIPDEIRERNVFLWFPKKNYDEWIWWERVTIREVWIDPYWTTPRKRIPGYWKFVAIYAYKKEKK